MDTSTGQLATKIRGTLKWNLSNYLLKPITKNENKNNKNIFLPLAGETEDDRLNRLSMNSSQKQKSNQNLLLYKKNGASPPISPRQPINEVHRQATTYNYNYRDPYLASNTSLDSLSGNNQKIITTVDPLRPPAEYLSQNFANLTNSNSNNTMSYSPRQTQKIMPMTLNQNNLQMTSIEREAADRYNAKLMTKSNSFANRPKAGVELNRVSNKLYNDNQPTVEYPNNPYWFQKF